MVDIYLVRHGEAAAAWGDAPDPGLSVLGQRQAEQVRDTLQAHSPLKVYSSPLLRAQETAQPLAAALKVALEIDTDFREIPSPVGLDDRQAWLSEFMKQQWTEQSPEVLGWRETAWRKLFEVEVDTAIFTHFVIINAICSKLTASLETVCCMPANGAIVHLQLEGEALRLVDVGQQLQTRVN